MLSCTDVREALSARLDNELGPSEVGRIDQHVAGCSACRDAARALAAVRARVRTLPPLAAPADLRARIAGLVEGRGAPAEGEATAPAPARIGALRRAVQGRIIRPLRAAVSPRFGPALAAFGLTAALLLGVVGGTQIGVFSPRGVRAAVTDHLRHLEREEAYSVASHDATVVDAYFQGFAAYRGFSAVLPAVNTTLEGARVCRLCGEPAAHLSFLDARKRPLSVYLVSERSPRSKWGYRVTRAGGSYDVLRCRGCWVASWRWQDVRCVVVCRSSATHVLDHAEHVRASLLAARS